MVDSAGVEIATYAGPDVPLDWRFDSLFALGDTDAGEQSFYELQGGVVGADARGNLYVLDTSAKRIAVFDSAGRFVRLMGKPGGGPGEGGAPRGLPGAHPARVTHQSPRAFRACGACGQRWLTPERFLDDPRLRVVGLQVAPHAPEANLLVFEHGCGSSVSVLTHRLRSCLADAPRGDAVDDLYDAPECNRLCRRLEEWAACDRPCVNARDRRLLQVILARKGVTPPHSGSAGPLTPPPAAAPPPARRA